jgi:hypothetical protein
VLQRGPLRQIAGGCRALDHGTPRPAQCGGVIATVTLYGQARFRGWSGADAIEWETADGDLVILRGNGWPTEASTCLVHEAERPAVGDRMIVTYRHNKGGPGADYFA